MRVSVRLEIARKPYIDQLLRQALRSTNTGSHFKFSEAVRQASNTGSVTHSFSSYISGCHLTSRRFFEMAHVLHGLNCADKARSSLLLDNFRSGGRDRVMVVADFDYTLTVRRGENGERGCLTHEVFDDGKKVQDCDPTVGEMQRRMNKDYLTAYRACSNDEERSYVNNKWWNTSHDIIIRSMMHQNDIPNLVRNSRLIWRRNVRHLFEVLEQSSIPLLIFSAGVTNIIDEAIRQLLGYHPSNITTAANVMSFDQNGFVSGFTDPPLHSLCKNVTRLVELVPEATGKFAERTNVLVVGDTDSDATMVDDWQEKQILKIGLETHEQQPLKLYDIVIKDPDCNRLTDIVQFILSM